MEIMCVFSLFLLLLAALVSCDNIKVQLSLNESQPIVNWTQIFGDEYKLNERLGGFTVALFYKNKFKCAGSLVHERLIISSAHCFVGKNIYHWQAIGGISAISDTGVVGTVAEIIMDNKINWHSEVNGLAILRLQNPMRGPNINAIQLCNSELDEGTKVIIAGWGFIDKNIHNVETYLRAVEVSIVNKENCTATYANYHNVNDNMLCAGGMGSIDFCVGDIGGPLIYYGECGPELCGTLSFGRRCSRPDYAAVYMDINKSMEWIIQNTEKFYESF